MKRILLILFGVLSTLHGWACTNYLVSRGASVDGSTMITYAADSHIRYGELYFSPAREWPAGSMAPFSTGGPPKRLGQKHKGAGPNRM